MNAITLGTETQAKAGKITHQNHNNMTKINGNQTMANQFKRFKKISTQYKNEIYKTICRHLKI